MNALLYTIVTGVIWGVVGIIFSSAVKRKINFIFFMFSYSLISAILALLFLPGYSAIFAPALSFPMLLLIVMFFVSVLASSGFYIMKLSMEKGPHGLIWAVIQAAMIIPFTLSIFLWKEFS